MGLHIPVDEVSVPQKSHGTCQLLEEVPNDDLVQPAVHGIGVLLDHLPQGRVISQLVSLLDEVRQVPKLAILHDQVYVRIRFPAVDQGNDMGMVQAFEDLDLAV